MKRLIPVLLLLPLLFACDKENAQNFETPHFSRFACQLTTKAGEVFYAVPTRAAAAPATPDFDTILSIELTESGLYVITHQISGEAKPRYFSGRYTVNAGSAGTADVYTLRGYGTLQFDSSHPGEVALTVKPDDGAAHVIMATLRKAAEGNKMYRSWNVDKTRVTVRGWTVASADFDGCNFHEIAEFLRKNGHKAPGDVPAGYGLEAITFTGTNSVIFSYTDNSLDMGEFSLSGSSISYRWDNDRLGFTFLTQEATVEYLDGKCILKLDATIQNSTTSGSVTFVLSPAE